MEKTATKNRGLDMTKGPVLKTIIKFALPIMLGQLLQQLYSTVDGIVVGNYVSSTALGAVGNCATMAFFFIALSVGMSNGSGIVISQAFGARREHDMRAAEVSVLFVMLLMGAAFTLFGFFCADFCVRTVLGIAEPDLQEQAATYLRIYSVGLICTCMYNAISAILRAVGDSKAVLYFLLVSTGVNTILDLLFVVRFGWGVAGAAGATVISQAACLLVSFFYMFKRYPVFRIKALRELLPEGRILKLCLQMGVPTTLQQLVISSGHLLLQRLVNSFGEATIAAVTVGSRFDHYASIPIMGMFQSTASFSGQNVGAGQMDRVKRGAWYSAIFCVCIVIFLCSLLYIFAAQLGSLFGISGETLQLTVRYLHALAFALPTFAFYIPFNGTMQGAGAPFTSMLVSCSALIVRVVTSYVLAFRFDYGCNSCWDTYVIGWSVALVLAMILFFRGGWKTKRLMRTVAEEKELEKLI